MSERHSRASSLSLVSGLGTSSVSGTSESGHVNIDELDDEQLKTAIFKLRDSLKRNRMETEIFESYYERLMSGNLSIVNTSSTQSRKTSATQSSNMTPESDSIIQTPSLLDGQRGRLSRKKSSSRTSLASRHKSMKLSIEQRCGIARKELAGIELELKEDRSLSQQKIHHGNFIIGERSQRIHELFKSIERLDKVLPSHSQTVRDPSELLNPKDQLRRILDQQLKYENQFLAKMKTKNIVLKSEIVQTNCHIVKRQAIVDEIGTVDHAQLCIENNKYLKDLDDMEGELTRCRERLRKLRLQMDKYIAEHASCLDKRKSIAQSNQALKGTINDLNNFLKLKKKENNKVIREINHLLKKKDSLGTESSSVDDIVSRYLMIEKNKKCRSALLRKKNLRKLESMPRRRAKSSEPSPALYRGLTYDLYFCMPDS